MKHILLLANSDETLYLLRKELIVELLKEYKVSVCLPCGYYWEKLISIGCELLEIKMDRRGMNPIKDFRTFTEILKTISKEKPDIVLSYTIKPNLYGGIVCSILKIPYIVNITGLGKAFEEKSILKKL